jgi:uncharacterized membrane protein
VLKLVTVVSGYFRLSSAIFGNFQRFLAASGHLRSFLVLPVWINDPPSALTADCVIDCTMISIFSLGSIGSIGAMSSLLGLAPWLTPAWFPASHWIMLGLLVGFAVLHSGLAALRIKGEALIGARAYRVLFALVSLPAAGLLITYFFNHRYDGIQLWQLQGETWVQPVVWILSAISFLFLYPATFNLLEVAAVAKPQVHLYETGIIRITRHPQAIGQIIWCVGHALWLGTSFMMVTCAGLIAHHLFAIWHGDRRLYGRYGDAFLKVKERTSIIPFRAVFDGRQTLQLAEFLRPAYVGVTAFVLGFWWAHPTLIRLTASVNW